mmetsp:Transcript_30199/g.66015  ORF Transcript_30199/g.66015 Transcript_30199/m.66015 type:complete len:135 (+) Transcript_30199:705-1109(+)
MLQKKAKRSSKKLRRIPVSPVDASTPTKEKEMPEEVSGSATTPAKEKQEIAPNGSSAASGCLLGEQTRKGKSLAGVANVETQAPEMPEEVPTAHLETKRYHAQRTTEQSQSSDGSSRRPSKRRQALKRANVQSR